MMHSKNKRRKQESDGSGMDTYGGAIYWDHSDNAYLNNCNFVNCSSLSLGSMYIYNNAWWCYLSIREF